MCVSVFVCVWLSECVCLCVSGLAQLERVILANHVCKKGLSACGALHKEIFKQEERVGGEFLDTQHYNRHITSLLLPPIGPNRDWVTFFDTQ